MTDKKSNDNRRNLLKSIAVGSGAVVAGKSIPEAWSKPAVDSILLPAHAATTTDDLPTERVCCEGVFCLLQFSGGGGIVGSAAVSSECTITMEGDSQGGLWSGSGTVAADGSFTIPLTFEIAGPSEATGTVTADCSRIIGEFGSGGEGQPFSFSGAVTQGVTSIEECLQPSDMRLKTNIEVLPTSRKGYNLYKFQYIDDKNENIYVGVMAQDILSRNPEAVVQNESGFYMVRYGLLGLKMVTFDEWESKGPDSVELKH